MPENPAGDWREGPDVKPGEMAPNNPEAKSAKPINEATDIELLTYMRDAMCAEALTLWQSALEATRRTMASPINPETGQKWLTPEERDTVIAVAWGKALDKLDGVEIIVDQMKYRANNLRCRGIMPGDPREKKLLEISLGIES